MCFYKDVGVEVHKSNHNMKMEEKNKECFIISPIGGEDSEIRKKSDKILKYIISPSVSEFGYNLIRADSISAPGMITSQIIKHILECPLLIADLSEKNPNVFYELALRHAVNKPVIQLISKGESIPFDISGVRTIIFDITDIENIDLTKIELKKQIRSIEKGEKIIDNPISLVLELEIFRNLDDNPILESIAKLIEQNHDSLSKFSSSLSEHNHEIAKLHMGTIEQLNKEHIEQIKVYSKIEKRAKESEVIMAFYNIVTELTGGISNLIYDESKYVESKNELRFDLDEIGDNLEKLFDKTNQRLQDAIGRKFSKDNKSKMHITKGKNNPTGR